MNTLNLNPSRSEVLRTLKRLENALYENGKVELLPPGQIDLEIVADQIFKLLQEVKDEKDERYKLLRLRNIYNQVGTISTKAFFFPEGDRRDRNTLLDQRQKYLISGYFSKALALPELYPKGTSLLFDTLEELRYFRPEVYNDAHIKEWTYEDWDLGVEFIKPNDWASGQAWGVRYSINSEEYQKECGYRFSVDYIAKEVAESVELTQKELGEGYVTGDLLAYQEEYEKILAQPAYTIPSLEDFKALYRKAATDTGFANPSLPVFTNAGKERAIAIGSTYSGGPRKWPIEWLDWYTWIGSRSGLEYYHFVPPSMIGARNHKFVQGDAEALFRFCKELEQPQLRKSSRSKSTSSGRNIQLELLKALLSQPYGPQSYGTVAKAVPTRNMGDRSSSSVGRNRAKFEKGELTFSKLDIDLIVRQLGGEDLVENKRLLKAVRTYQTLE